MRMYHPSLRGRSEATDEAIPPFRDCFARLRLARNDKLGQATLEFTLVFLIMSVLLMGLLSLWKWSSDNIVKRQQSYNSSRVQEGSRGIASSSAGALPGSSLDNSQSLLDSLKGGAEAFSLLPLEQINSNLEKVNKSISDIQTNLPFMAGLRDTWQNDFDYARQEEASAQQKLESLKAQITSLERQKQNPQIAGYDEFGQPAYVDYDGQISLLNQEIAKTQNGYYTVETPSWDANGSYVPIITYDYSNGPWMGRFGTREAWAQDYWAYRQYGVSEGNNTYGLYTNYTPGLLDWQARTAYAQEQRDLLQKSVTNTNNVLVSLQDMRGKLQKAKDSKEK